MNVVWIVLACLAGLVPLLLVMSLISKATLAAMAGPLKARIAARLSDRDIVSSDLRANFFGLESKGAAQLRGNGALVLTRSAIHFFQFLPARDFEVPLASVREVSLVRSHLGKSVGYRLLKVRFEGDAGPDSIAWYVPEAEAWQRKVESARGDVSA